MVQSRSPVNRAGRLLAPGGALLLVIADLRGVLLAPPRSNRTGHVMTAGVRKPTAEDLLPSSTSPRPAATGRFATGPAT